MGTTTISKIINSKIPHVSLIGVPGPTCQWRLWYFPTNVIFVMIWRIHPI